mgnify:CR=1 FL=1
MISAVLNLKDNLSSKLNAAAQKAQSLARGIGNASKGIGDFKPVRLDVKGMEKLQRLQSMLRSGGMTVPPVNIRVNDNGSTSKISKLRADINSVAGKAHTVMINVKTNGAAALGKLKSNISELTTGAAMGMGGTMLGMAGIGFGAANVVENYKDFEYQAMRNKALFTTGLDAETAEKQYQDLTAAARYYGSTMKFTAAEVGKALEYEALAGWDAPTAIKALPAILNAAVASGEDLASVTDIITDAMTALNYKAGTMVKNALGQDVEAAQHFADVMLRTTLRSNTNFQQLGYAMKYAAPLANTLGYKIEDVAVAFGLMANNGIKADMAGTALRGMLVRLSKPPKQAAEALNKLGTSLFDEKGERKGLLPALMDMRAALNGKTDDEMINFAEQMTGEQVENRAELTDFLKEARERGGGKISRQDRAKLAGMLSGTYALAGFMALMNSTDEDIQKLMTEIYQKSDGTGADISNQMSNTLQGDLKTLESAWQDFNIELLSGGGGDGIRNFVQGLTDDINTFKTSLKDGLDFGDIADLGAKVIGQLKNKFLELNGIGSLLAGGALFMGLKKVLSTALSLKDAITNIAKAKSASDVGNLLRGNQSLMSQVGTMNVSAGVVNVNGAVRGNPANQRGGTVISGQNQRGGTVISQPNQRGTILSGGKSQPNLRGTLATAGAATAGSILLSNRSGSNITTYNPAIRQQEIAARNSAYVNDYYARRNNVLSATPPPATGSMSTLRANAGGIGLGVGLAALFALMDISSAREHSQVTSREAAETLAYHKNVLAQMREQNAGQDEIAAQMKEVNDAQAFVDRTQAMNKRVERQAEMSAAGMVAGTAIGGAIGSFVPIIGNLLGGMLGGMLGHWAGSKISDYASDQEEARIANQPADKGVTFVKEQIAADKTSGMGRVVNDTREIRDVERRHAEYQNKPKVTELSSDFQIKPQGNASNWTNYGAPQINKPSEKYGGAEGAFKQPNGGSEGSFAEKRPSEVYQDYVDRQDMAALAHQRDLYNKRWQEQFGGTSLAGQANFIPDNERDRQLLARYDTEKAESARQAKINEVAESAREVKPFDFNQKDYFKPQDYQTKPFDYSRPFDFKNETPKLQGVDTNQSLTQAQENLNKLAQSSQQWNQQAQTQIANQQKIAENAKNSTGIFEGIGNFLDGLLFNKAAASELKPETNMTLSSPPEIPSVEPPKVDKGFFDFEMPDFSKIFDFQMPEFPDFSKIFDFEMPTFPNFGEMFSNIELPDFKDIFSFEMPEMPNFKDMFDFEMPEIPNFLEQLPDISSVELPNLSELFSDIELPNLSELFSDIEMPDFGTKISEMFSNIDIPNLGESLGSVFSGIELPELGIGEKISAEFEGATAVFEGFTSSVTATFSGLAGSISGALSGVGSAITSVFSNAASQVQSLWGAMPGFFSGIFGSLGGVAAAAGSAIAAGLTSGIGSVIGAWSAAAAQISSIISSIASAASSAAASAGSISVGGHAKGTSYFEGGFTEINEHGGEILNLPKGTQIIPHATTVNILRKEIRNSISNGETDYHGLSFADYGLTNINNQAQKNYQSSNFTSETSNILSGDVIPTMPKTKPKREVKVGTRWNKKSSTPFTNISLGHGIWAEILGRTMDKFKTPQQEINFPPIMNFGGDTELPLLSAMAMPNQNFSDNFNPSFNLDDKFDFKVPQIETPKVAESNSTNTSNSNTISFGDIHISGGADLDEFMFRLQQLLGQAVINSEYA